MNRSKLGMRAALGVAAMVWLAATGQRVQAVEAMQWYRGQLHAHSYWSDGRGFPEQAIEAYKQRGYHFMCLSEHNRFADDPAQWREVAPEEGTWPPQVTEEIFDAYVSTFGTGWVDSRTDGSVTSVRLKTYAEVKAKFEDPGNFIVMPGVELTQTLHGISVHQNYVQLPVILPIIEGAELIQTLDQPASVSELISIVTSQIEQAATQLQEPCVLMLNHPFAAYCDIVPQNLIDCPDVRFFEVCNGGSRFAPHPRALSYTVEKFWDVVNAFRRLQGHALLYGIGSDDAHFYDAKRIDGVSGVGDAWVMVRAEALTPKHLIAAMERGDFYATTGVVLDEVAFSTADNTLRVKVKPEQGTTYTIQFVTTKRGFDQSVSTIDSPAENDRPARTIPVYSSDIGRMVKSVTGTEAEYQLAPDDLYVRARIESDKPSKYVEYFHPTVQTAWTQPYAPE